MPTSVANRQLRLNTATTTFSGVVAGAYDNNNDQLLKYITITHTSQQTNFTLTLNNANNCNLDLSVSWFANLILNVGVYLSDGSFVAAGTVIPTNVLWGTFTKGSVVIPTSNCRNFSLYAISGVFFLDTDEVANSLTDKRTNVPLSAEQGRVLNSYVAAAQYTANSAFTSVNNLAKTICYGRVSLNDTANSASIISQGGTTSVGVNKFSIAYYSGGYIFIVTHNYGNNYIVLCGQTYAGSTIIASAVPVNNNSFYISMTNDANAAYKNKVTVDFMCIAI